MRKWIDRLFCHEEIDGGKICPTYLHRWTLLKCGEAFSVYLHHFVGDDWALDPHDHPKTFTSIGLLGFYFEEDYADLERPRTVLWMAPWFRKFQPEHRHRIWMPKGGSCWTICIVGRPQREWGFWYHCEHWLPWKVYVKGGPGVERKAC